MDFPLTDFFTVPTETLFHASETVPFMFYQLISCANQITFVHQGDKQEDKQEDQREGAESPDLFVTPPDDQEQLSDKVVCDNCIM